MPAITPTPSSYPSLRGQQRRALRQTATEGPGEWV